MLVYMYTTQQENRIHRFLLESAAHASHNVDRAIGEQIGLLHGLSSARSLDDGNFDSFRINTQRLISVHPEWRTVIVTDQKVPLFNHRFQPGEALTPLRDPNSLARVWQTQKPYVGDLANGFVAIRVPVIRDRQVRYTLVVPVETQFFLEAIHTSPQTGSHGYIIIGSDGIVIASSANAPAESGQLLPPQFFIRDSLTRVVGESIYTAPSPIKTSGWQLILFAPNDEIMAPFENTRLFVYAGGFLAAVFTVAMVLAMGATWAARHEAIGLHEEIAARLKTEEDLRRTEFSLREAQRLAEIGSWRWDIPSDRHVWSEEVYRIYGRDPQLPPAIYPEVKEYFTPESWVHLSAAVEEGLNQGDSYQCDAEVVRQDGSHRWITARGQAVRDSEGKVAALFGTVQDITERKKAEKTIQQHRQTLQLFIEHAPAAIAMFDTEMRYLAVSNRFLTDYGITDGQVIGKSHYDLFPEIDERWRDVHRRCLAGATERCAEDPFPRADGRTDWISWEILPWHEQKGKIGGIILLSENVTERVEAAEKLIKSEKKFRDLFDKHAAVKLIIDPHNGDIIDANQAAVKFYGWPGEQLRQMRIQDLSSFSPDQVEAELNKAENQQRLYGEFSHRVADGSTRDVAVYRSKVDIQGRSLVHLIVHDISASKQVEREQANLREQLIQAQKMESVGRLAGGVAHDYNNMLSVIIGFSELAMKKIASDHQVYDDLLEIHKAARRSVDITRQLLAFARKQTIRPQVLDLNVIVAEMLRMLHRLIGEDIDLAWRPETDLWAVNMDPSQFDQILANLCVNARDAIGGVGKITIETNNVTFNEAYCADHLGCIPGEYVLLAVSDDGIGMDKETLAHIFEPFFTTKGIGEGTGLGLATVFGIVKQNEGFVSVYSEPGKGTTFRLYLPRHRGETTSQALGTMEEIPQGCGQVVLLVEDEAAIRKLGTKMLQQLGYQVLAAEAPSEAIRLAEERIGGIDLLLTDVVMSEMNGRDLADQMRSRYPDIKILFMSGYTSNVIAHRGVLDDGVNFLAKPFSKNDLALKVCSALARG
jgi:PAS domain S-box-containing protein